MRKSIASGLAFGNFNGFRSAISTGFVRQFQLAEGAGISGSDKRDHPGRTRWGQRALPNSQNTCKTSARRVEDNAPLPLRVTVAKHCPAYGRFIVLLLSFLSLQFTI
ncbi:MAG: hypothetical protein II649_09265 [Kiritimatiellae bacterium]|nr:hypothetical protein [Kiritimatiellia bacterium]